MLANYPSLTPDYVKWHLPLVLAFAMITAGNIRQGKKVPGPTYADLDLIARLEQLANEET